MAGNVVPAPVAGVLRRLARLLIPKQGNPAQVVVIGFATAILIGTLLLMLPAATESGEPTNPVTALFTSTSAVCVTGLIIEDTPVHWSTFGELVIMCLFQLGGLGIMTVASVLVLLIARRMGLRMQLSTQTETKSLGLGEVRRVAAGIVVVSVVFEVTLAAALTLRLMFGYDKPFGEALYSGVFHSISAFNNAGFSVNSDSLIGFAADPLVILPIGVAVICGGIGFPVLFELWRHRPARRHRVRRWSLHAKITLLATGVLLLGGMIAVTAAEWTNPATLGPMSVHNKLMNGFFHSLTARTAGFNSVDVGQMHSATLLVNDVLMFIGGGSAGTAGGIKVGTFALLAFVIYAEIRGEPSVHVMGRRLPASVQRQALTVALLSVGAVVTGTLTLLVITPFRLDDVLFEVISAFGTVGLSTGITADLGAAGHLVLVALMFIGRLGPITLASALALRDRTRRYERPEERPIVG